MNKNKWFLNGGRGSGRSFRLLCETYENKIADLEKENAELKKKLKEKLKTIADKDLSFVAKFDALEKENAELKAVERMALYSKMSDQLTKAKEIIKNLLTLSMPIDYAKCPIPLQKIAEAEQFLKDQEEEPCGQ